MTELRASGPGGECVCLGCGTKAPHRPGAPCREERCPKCGKAMVREGSAHHLAFLEKRKTTKGDA